MPGKTPGSQYSWMLYLRNGLFNPEFLSAVSQLFILKIKEKIGHFDFQIAGLETGSTPMLAGIPLVGREFNIDINAFSIRKNQKQYGLLNWLEGAPNDKPVMIIDDVCNSSKSMKKCYDVCSSSRLSIFNYAFCIVNKSSNKVSNNHYVNTDEYLPPNIKIISLFDFNDFNLNTQS